jgi:hypothetical protein
MARKTLPTSLPNPTFEKCVGQEFVIEGFNNVGMAELHIKSVTGKVCETIWVETKFLQSISK